MQAHCFAVRLFKIFRFFPDGKCGTIPAGAENAWRCGTKPEKLKDPEKLKAPEKLKDPEKPGDTSIK